MNKTVKLWTKFDENEIRLYEIRKSYKEVVVDNLITIKRMADDLVNLFKRYESIELDELKILNRMGYLSINYVQTTYNKIVGVTKDDQSLFSYITATCQKLWKQNMENLWIAREEWEKLKTNNIDITEELFAINNDYLTNEDSERIAKEEVDYKLEIRLNKKTRFKNVLFRVIYSDGITWFTENPKVGHTGLNVYKKYAISYWLTIFCTLFLSIILFGLQDHNDNNTYKAFRTIVEIFVFSVLFIDFFSRIYVSKLRNGYYFFDSKNIIKQNRWQALFSMIGNPGNWILFFSLLSTIYMVGDIFNDSKSTLWALMIIFRVFILLILLSKIPYIGIIKRAITTLVLPLFYTLITIMILILLFSLILYKVEHATNDDVTTFFDAIYFSTIALTTIGFGDITAKTATGRAFIMVMSIIGLLLIAIPAGLSTGVFIDEIRYYNMISMLVSKHKDIVKSHNQIDYNILKWMKIDNIRRESSLKCNDSPEQLKSLRVLEEQNVKLRNDFLDSFYQEKHEI